MAAPQVRRKWRPPLALIVLAVLLAVLTLPAAMVVGFRAIDNTSSQMGPIEIGAMILALALTIVIALVFARAVTGPIDALIRRTEEISMGGRAAIAPLETYGTREIATLSQSFLDLAGRLVDRTEYVHSFAAHVSQELKSPLTSIRGAAELIRDADMSEAERRRFLDHIIADADRLDALLGRLRELARAETPLTGGGTSVGALVDDITNRFPKLAVTLIGAPTMRVALPLEAGTIILSHLADNSLRHGATRLILTAAPDGAHVRLTIADDGSGITPTNRARVFEPFFTTRRETGGTGMGLQIARTMLASHHGGIELVDADKGAVFEITVPAG